MYDIKILLNCINHLVSHYLNLMPSKSKKDVDFNSTKDPYAQREAEKYENPIPSRELILRL